jgi:hypothetical protein
MRAPGGMRDVLSSVLARRRYRRAVVGIAVVYLLMFLLSLQNLTIPGGPATFRTGPLDAMFRRTGFLLFDAVALVQTPLFTLLVAPVNIAIGAVLSLLVGLNLTLSFIAWRQPKVCAIDRAAGAAGILPGLLAGGACCAPTILLIAGLQATAALVTAIQWMIPVAFVLLVGSLVWISTKTNPDLL